ncbi:MAG: signal peptidase I [Candidatus Lloydbacteria bacterium RIFCSPHIGHO2_02_FULL_51_22]|uniref:Signal peptidase I n=2 Tax=Candidatus Lloydiibacteriota TaxID=1817910 RepID=A0A1G2D7E1_9BACT|nr:MAG: signal peptidase I [Candidatus Lloydbacteria bacterium RIFCSPHIGHO2_02_FULL_51_22]OGZ15275.1 MAG: signal peptidase I [Candidatus Lloydbacteria bacterium RIFCSPLOWO2_02_FULL_51_11]
MFRLTVKQGWQIFLAVAITGIFLRVFLIDTFFVSGNSMSPLIREHDYIFVNKFAYRFRGEPERNDVVVSRFRKDAFSDSHSPRTVKRVIGLPRERVEIMPEKVVIKKTRTDTGFALEETSYLALANLPLNGTSTVVLDPEEYFLLGDNRFVSTDSRELGPVDKWNLDGKVFFIIRPRSLSFFFL